MSDSIRLTERIQMLQQAIYEQYPEYISNIPGSWSRYFLVYSHSSEQDVRLSLLGLSLKLSPHLDIQPLLA